MLFKTERLLIRTVELKDVQNIHALHSLPETDQYNTLGIPESKAVTEELVASWIVLEKELPITKYVFVIEDSEGAFIGLFGINIGKPKHKNAELWFKLLPNHWHKGYATESALTILNLCFKQLKLHRIEAGCAVGNIASKKVLEKIGMQLEGVSRKILPIRGEWFDGYRFSILEEEYFLQ